MADRNIEGVVIGGAAGSLGQCLISFYCNRKVKVAAVCRGAQEIVVLEEYIKKESLSDFCFTVEADLSSEQAVSGLVKLVSNKIGRVDAVVNAAGAFTWKPISSTTEKDYEVLLDSNLKTTWNLLRTFLPVMREQNFGRMVFVSSKATQNQAAMGLGLYLAAKAGINMLVQTAAEEMKEHDININAVLPSIIDNKQNRIDMPDADYDSWVSPAGLAEFIGTLCDPVSKHLNGSLIPVSGRV